jgi:hypothetical protein
MIKITGLEQFKDYLGKVSKKIEEEAKLQVLDSATAIELNAKALAPIGAPIDKIATRQGLGSVIGYQSNDPIWAYGEFGTGEFAAAYLANMEPEVKEMARQFYVNGEGTLETQAALIPAFFRERGKFVMEMRKLVIKNIRNA